MHYPVMLDIQNKSVVVIGGGKVAERKVRGILPYKPRVAVIGTRCSPYLHELSKSGKISVKERPYEPGDVQRAYMVFAATNHPLVNEQVYQEAKGEGILVNIADRPELCTFTVPAVVNRGHLQIAVSTSGASPAVAKLIRFQLEELFDQSYMPYLEWLSTWRTRLLQEVSDEETRRTILRKLAAPEFRELFLHHGQEYLEAKARNVMKSCLETHTPNTCVEE